MGCSCTPWGAELDKDYDGTLGQIAAIGYTEVEKPLDSGEIGYEVIPRESDPSLVKFELDCGWMVAAGHDPVDFLTKYPKRYRLLHIKDLRPTASPSVGLDESARPKPAELGHGHTEVEL